MSISSDRIVKKFLVISDDGSAQQFAPLHDTFDDAAAWVDYQQQHGASNYFTIIEGFHINPPAA